VRTPARRIPCMHGASETRVHAFRSHRCRRRRVASVLARGANAEPVPITNSDLQVAYYGAPLITSGQAKAIPLGITRRQLVNRLHGRSVNHLAAHRNALAWKVCIVYPVKGTGVKYRDGFVAADEWEFCFGFNGRLKRKFFTHAYHI
jgi:hypothetical protein